MSKKMNIELELETNLSTNMDDIDFYIDEVLTAIADRIANGGMRQEGKQLNSTKVVKVARASFAQTGMWKKSVAFNDDGSGIPAEQRRTGREA